MEALSIEFSRCRKMTDISDWLIDSVSAVSVCKSHFVEKSIQKIDSMSRIRECRSVIRYGIKIGDTCAVKCMDVI